MSEIGTRNFFLLGYFQRIPLYQPLWPISIDQSRHDNRQANLMPGQLVLGGGSGEHRAIIFTDVELCVALLLCSKWSPTHTPANPELIERAMAKYATNGIEYCNWTNVDHRRFFDGCRLDYEWFSTKNSFQQEDEEVYRDEHGAEQRNASETAFEMWLGLSIGEFVYVSLSDFTPTIKRWRVEHGEPVEQVFRQVLVPPPGYQPREDPRASEEELRTHGGICRFRVEDRWPGYHRNPEW